MASRQQEALQASAIVQLDGPNCNPSAEEWKLRNGVTLELQPGGSPSDDGYYFFADIRGKLDHVAFFVSGLAPRAEATYPITLQWKLCTGVECALDYDSPVFEGVTILTDKDDLRQGKLVEVAGLLASRWALYAKIVTADAPAFRMNLSGLVALRGCGSNIEVSTGSVIG